MTHLEIPPQVNPGIIQHNFRDSFRDFLRYISRDSPRDCYQDSSRSSSKDSFRDFFRGILLGVFPGNLAKILLGFFPRIFLEILPGIPLECLDEILCRINPGLLPGIPSKISPGSQGRVLQRIPSEIAPRISAGIPFLSGSSRYRKRGSLINFIWRPNCNSILYRKLYNRYVFMIIIILPFLVHSCQKKKKSFPFSFFLKKLIFHYFLGGFNVFLSLLEALVYNNRLPLRVPTCKTSVFNFLCNLDYELAILNENQF